MKPDWDTSLRPVWSVSRVGQCPRKVPGIRGLNDCGTEWTKSCIPTQKSSVILWPQQLLFPLAINEERSKVTSSWRFKNELFLVTYPCTLAEMVLLIIAFSFSYASWVSSGELFYSKMTIFDNIVCLKFAKRVNLGCSQHKKKENS